MEYIDKPIRTNIILIRNWHNNIVFSCETEYGSPVLAETVWGLDKTVFKVNTIKNTPTKITRFKETVIKGIYWLQYEPVIYSDQITISCFYKGFQFNALTIITNK